MSPPRNPAHDDALVLRERGWSYSRIGKALGVPKGRVAWWCVLGGADPPMPPRKSWNPPPGAVVMCGGVERRYVTADEDAVILAMEGASLVKIGRAIGRSPNTVRYRRAALARAAERAERGGA